MANADSITTTISVPADLAEEVKAEADRNQRRGWTNELVILAREGLEARRQKPAAA